MWTRETTRGFLAERQEETDTAGDDKGKVRGRRRGSNQKQKWRTKKAHECAQIILMCTEHQQWIIIKKKKQGLVLSVLLQPVATSPASSSNKRIAGRFVSVFCAVPAGEACRVRPDDGPLAPHAAAVQATSTKLYCVYGCRPAVREGGRRRKRVIKKKKKF